MSKLLVIGGTGFFGKSILDAYRRGLLEPWGISHLILMARNTDRLSEEVPHLLGEGVEFFSADIATTKTIPTADYIIHAAASTDVRNYLSSPKEERRNIQAGTYHYCDLAQKYHDKSKILYVSSGAVYGMQPPNLEKVDENFIGDLSNLPPGKLDYAFAKRDAESAIISLGQSGLNVSIARCFAFVGQWLPRDQHFAIGNFINDAMNLRAIRVNSTRKVYRSYMYADDLVEWLMMICESASTNCQVYNVGSDVEVSIRMLAEIISKKMNVELQFQSSQNFEDVDRYVPSIDKAKKYLGLGLKFDLDKSIDETIEKIKLSHN